MDSDPKESKLEVPEEARRPFLVRLLTGTLGILLGLVPLTAGAVVFFSPLRRRKETEAELVRVASLSALPADGVPRRFPVIDERSDAWTRYPREPIGAVFLRRTDPDQPPQAVSAVCPHLGCMVNFRTDAEDFKCPCHNSHWTPEGERIDPRRCPSPRDLDALEVEVENDDVYVRYQKFRSGIAAKVPE